MNPHNFITHSKRLSKTLRVKTDKIWELLNELQQLTSELEDNFSESKNSTLESFDDDDDDSEVRERIDDLGFLDNEHLLNVMQVFKEDWGDNLNSFDSELNTIVEVLNE